MLKKRKSAVLGSVFGYAFMATLIGLVFVVGFNAKAYNCKPGDTECEAAKANMQQNKNEAKEYSAKAESVGQVIEQLGAEINSLNAEIANNETKIETLNKEIKENEAKLIETQNALAEMLVDIHFDESSEPISVLAGSKSISDYAERQARNEVAKQEIAAASERIKDIKSKLNAKKNEVEKALTLSEENKKIVAARRSDQESLMSQYEKSADDASALASYWEEQLKALAWTPPSNTSGSGTRSWGSYNSYPYRYNCPQDNVMYNAYGGAVCQCTSYASYKAYEKWGISNTWGGHAYNYVNAVGYYVPGSGATTYVDKNPAANTIAIQLGGAYGHVMWVESVNADGSINVSEYNVNWSAIGCNLGDFCSRNAVGSAGTWFLHFD